MTTLSAVYPHRKIWTSDEVSKLNDIFPGQRLELIEGDLVNKIGQKPPHAYVIAMLNKMLSEAFPGRVRIQSSITLPKPESTRSEPEPDVVLLHRESSDFFQRHPSPQDIALLIEVSDSTLQLDREIKGPLYSRCGIEVYWIIDIQQRRIVVFQTPGPDEYKSVTIHEANERVSFDRQFSIPVHSLFG
jgi:Uma2 family endonuclease